MKKKIILFVILISLSFLNFACVINNYVIDDKPARKKKITPVDREKNKSSINYTLNLFNFSVKDEKDEKHEIFLRITIVCKNQLNLKKIIKKNQPQIEKQIRYLLLRKKYIDFKLNQNIEKLKSEIIIKINNQIINDKAKKIYFSKLVII